MIVRNGYIRFGSMEGGGVDEHGKPIPSFLCWHEYRPCQWRYRNNSLQSVDAEGNPRADQSYEVLIDDCGIEGLRAQLTDEDYRTFCERGITSVETLKVVRKIRIVI